MFDVWLDKENPTLLPIACAALERIAASTSHMYVCNMYPVDYAGVFDISAAPLDPMDYPPSLFSEYIEGLSSPVVHPVGKCCLVCLHVSIAMTAQEGFDEAFTLTCGELCSLHGTSRANPNHLGEACDKRWAVVLTLLRYHEQMVCRNRKLPQVR